jgi:hypothetical protein
MKTSPPRRTGAAAAEVEGSCPRRGARPRNRDERRGKLPAQKSAAVVLSSPSSSSSAKRGAVDAGGGRELPEEGRAAEKSGQMARKTNGAKKSSSSHRHRRRRRGAHAGIRRRGRLHRMQGVTYQWGEGEE